MNDKPEDQYWKHRAYDHHMRLQENQIKATIESGHQAVKAALLLNGAATIAILSFLASAISSDFSGSRFEDLSQTFANSLIFFALGALLAAITSGLSYLANTSIGIEMARASLHDEVPFVRPAPKSNLWGRISLVSAILTMGCAVGSYFAFIAGLFTAVAWA